MNRLQQILTEAHNRTSQDQEGESDSWSHGSLDIDRHSMEYVWIS